MTLHIDQSNIEQKENGAIYLLYTVFREAVLFLFQFNFQNFVHVELIFHDFVEQFLHHLKVIGKPQPKHLQLMQMFRFSMC